MNIPKLIAFIIAAALMGCASLFGLMFGLGPIEAILVIALASFGTSVMSAAIVKEKS